MLIDGFLVPEKRHERTSHGFPLYLIMWWWWLRALEVKRWQERHLAESDASGGRIGGAERSWEPPLEMERFDFRTSEMDQGAITPRLDLAKLQFSFDNFAGAMWSGSRSRQEERMDRARSLRLAVTGREVSGI